MHSAEQLIIYRKKRYEMYRSKGICVNCHKRPAASGKVSCDECLFDKRINEKKHSSQDRGTFKDVLISQDFKCAICGEKTKLQMDHCHSCGKIRAFLCGSCNKGLGHFKENVYSLSNAMTYIMRCKHNRS